MKPRTLALAALLLAAAGGGAWWLLQDRAPAATFRLEEVQRKDVRETVSATGTLEAVVTVEVGTQVSGVLQEVLVDFNDRVEQGQVLARIDTSILEADVASAEATLALRRAELTQAEADLARTTRLHAQGVASDQELEDATTTREVTDAQVRAARTAQQRARQNLGYATITAPVAGTIIERAVDQGQTVNAGMSAPKLFLLAGDLSKMQILANVDEADIGRIAPGQAVDFTVQAYDSEHFGGTVRQVRLQSTVEENVVTYAVVVDVDNAEGKLLPGMTATVDFIVAEASDVLCVANAALRYRPDAGLVVADGQEEEQGKPGKGRRGRGDSKGRLWLPVEGGKLRRLPVSTGLSDGACTEVSGEGVAEGLEVVAGVTAAESTSTNPFQQQEQQRRPGGF